MSTLAEVIQKLEGTEDHMIGYRPPPYLRKKIAEALKGGEFRGVSELFTKALDDWFRDRELKTVYQAERKIK